MTLSEDKLSPYVAEEILSGAPTLLECIGGYLVGGLLVAFLAFAAVFRVPEKIIMPVTISTYPEVGTGYAMRRARLQHLLASEGDSLEKGMPVAVLETTADYAAVFRLRHALANGAEALSLPRLLEFSGLGVFEEQMSTLRQALVTFQHLEVGLTFRRTVESFEEEIRNRMEIRQTLNENRALAIAKLALLREEKDIREGLYRDGVGSRLNVQAIKSQIFDQESRILGFRQQIEENDLLIAALKRRLTETEETWERELSEAGMALENAVSLVTAAIVAWERDNLLKAPTAGVLRVVGPWDRQRYVDAGELVFVVQPKVQSLVATGHYDGQGLGQAAIGNLALVSLDDYPRHRFGKLQGRLESFSNVVVDGAQFIQLSLDTVTEQASRQGLVLRQGMTGQAEVITEPQTLLSRVWHAIDPGGR